ncbi:MAG: type II 3-dehydroquinate dehydratase [Pseudomonadota bacterium]|jgi:3-dehydroquinate dehydratase-2|nr:type II 3-dehydroquinate dehydratase [Pseudomonadota bacterium]|tara:strand:+ start:740 stop:1177 length:438 start_codon:yes stop_codon:yes gene_type:complete
MATFLLLNGPNLNLLGTREPEVYGDVTLEEIQNKLEEMCKKSGTDLVSFQSNAEHELVDRIQEAQSEGIKCIIFNPGAFTHSSIALRDALNGTGQKFIEVHISNIYGREDFRQKSFLSDIADGVISGLGTKGYELALEVAIERYS